MANRKQTNKFKARKLLYLSFLGTFYIIFCGLDPTLSLSNFVAEPE